MAVERQFINEGWLLSCVDDPKKADVLYTTAAAVRAPVPGCVLDALAHLLPDPFLLDHSTNPVWERLEHATFLYQRTFDLRDDFLRAPGRLLLRFEEIDTVATIRLNGRIIGKASNFFNPHEIEVDRCLLQPEGNEVTLEFGSLREYMRDREHTHAYREWNDPVGGISRVRKPQFTAGWDWGPRLLSVGITGDVSIVLVPTARVKTLAIDQSHTCTSSGTRVDVQLQFTVDVELTLDACKADSSPTKCSCQVTVGGLPTSVLDCVEPKSVLPDAQEAALDTEKTYTRRQFAGGVMVEDAALWWPNGYGDQPLYDVRVDCFTGEGESSQRMDAADCRLERVGLRTIRLDRTRDESSTSGSRRASQHMCGHSPIDGSDGESFTFVVNSRPLFAKGGNCIPLHAVVSRLKRKDYEQLLSSCVQANFNMLRVWGGGIYERDVFYDMCDERGILIWQDFMFSCSLYPGDDDFLRSCEAEVSYQATRLRNHACLALFCGNNELEQVPEHIMASTEAERSYQKLFYELIPSVLHSLSVQTDYWPSSPHDPRGYQHGFNNPVAGDTHFWDVWHARKPVNDYLKHSTRFCSEFGMQSMMSARYAIAAVGPDKALNPLNSLFESHQKNGGGNSIMMDYCSRQFQAPDSYASLSYQTQVNQALCVRTGVEHFRRSMPFCAGALFWQVNDVWPCASWSSIEFGGRWKALHYFARRFFAPLLVSLVHKGTESVGLCNLVRRSLETGIFEVHATYDGLLEALDTALSWKAYSTRTGELVATIPSPQPFRLRRDKSYLLITVDLREHMQKHGVHLVLRAILEPIQRAGVVQTLQASETTGWLTAPRFCELAQSSLGGIKCEASFVEGSKVAALFIHLTAESFFPFVELDIVADTAQWNGKEWQEPELYYFSDNYFDLFPDQTRVVKIILPPSFDIITDADQFCAKWLRVKSLRDSYMS